MKIRYSYSSSLIILALLCLTMFSQAQDKQVNGFVIDSTTEKPMSYVNIAVIGSTYGTVSNQNGEFKIYLDKIEQSDSLAFHFIGYQTHKLLISDLQDGIIIKMEEEQVKLKEITILANPVTVEELINNALYRRGTNYPDVYQKMEVFKRSNRANYIDDFELSLLKSDIKNIDTSFIKTIIDSLPRYSRSYQDNLYTLYSSPENPAVEKNKIEAIKRVILNENNGGDLERIENIMMEAMNKKEGERSIWKLKTGIISLKVDDTDNNQPQDTSSIIRLNLDSLALLNPSGLYRLTNSEFENWKWEFIRKPERYKYEIEGIVPIGDEFAYAISFKGRMRGDYQGMIYISDETYAFLRIEYSIKTRRKAKGFKLLGISYGDLDDSGLIIYNRDEHGYYLKYSMRSNSTTYSINRAFSLIKKKKRPIIRKKLNEVELDIEFTGRDVTVRETLVVYREELDKDIFDKTIDKGVKSERITSYSDSLWQGYSIIEPTKAMKEYKIKMQDGRPKT